MKKTGVLITTLLIPWLCFSQGQGNQWKLASTSLDFGITPVSVSASVIELIDDELESTSSISDSSGRLLFYSDGRRLWDWNDELIVDTLAGHQSATQGVIAVPFPQEVHKYLLFTIDALQNDLVNGLQFSVVNACRENGVTIEQVNTPLLDNLTEKMTVVRHSNGIDYWLVCHEFNSNSYVVFAITESGVLLSGTYPIGVTHGPDSASVVGQLKASPNGSFIASNITNSQFITEIVSFNNSTGEITQPVSFISDTFQGFPVGAYGLSFSENSEMLYLASSYDKRVFQFSVGHLPDVNAFLLSRELVYSFEDGNQTPPFQSLQLAVDGKIYISNLTDYLAIIENPNAQGSACGVQDSVIQLLAGNVFGLSNFIDSYDYTTTGICEPDGVEETNVVHALTVYPNPSNGQVTISLSVGVKPTAVGVLDMLGKKVVEMPYSHTIDVSRLPSGSYIIAVNTKEITYRQLLVVD